MPITFYIIGFRNNTAHDIYGWDEFSLVIVSNPLKRTLWTYEVNEVRIESSQDEQQQLKYSMCLKDEIRLQLLEDKFESFTRLIEWLHAVTASMLSPLYPSSHISTGNSKKPKVSSNALESARDGIEATVGQINTLLNQPEIPQQKVSVLKKLLKSKPHVANEIESIKEQLAASEEKFTSLATLVKQLVPTLSKVLVLDKELEITSTRLIKQNKELNARFKLASGKEKELRKAAEANEKVNNDLIVAETNDWKKGKALEKSRAQETELKKQLETAAKELVESRQAHNRQVKELEDEKVALQRSQSELKARVLSLTRSEEEQKRALKASTEASILKEQEYTNALAISYTEVENLKAKLAASQQEATSSRDACELSRQLSEKEQEVVILRNENTALQAKSRDLSRELAEKEAELMKYKEKSKIFEEQLRAAKNNENELERAMREIKSKEIELQERMAESEKEHARQLQDLKQELSLMIGAKDLELKRVNENKERELASAKVKEKELAQQLQELFIKDQELQRVNESKDLELQRANEHKQQEVAAARTKERELAQQLQELSLKIGDKDQELQRVKDSKKTELAAAAAKEMEYTRLLQELALKIGEKDQELQRANENKQQEVVVAKAKEKEHALQLQELSLMIGEKEKELQWVNENVEKELASARVKEKEHARHLHELSLKIGEKNQELQRANEKKERELGELRIASESQMKELREKLPNPQHTADAATLQAKVKELERLKQDLNEANEKMAKLEEQHQYKQEFALSTLRAKFNGMHEVGSVARKSSSAFKELRDNTMTNQLLSLTENDPDLDIFFPVVSSIPLSSIRIAIFDVDEEYAFHLFWGTVLGEEEPNHDAKLKRAKQIKDNKEEIQRCAEIVATATFTACNAAAANTSSALVTTREHFHSHMLPFFIQCAQWHIDMVFCDPVLELLPRGRVPKKDTPLNNVEGQQFELSFDGFGIPIVDSVEKPGLMLCDLNGIIYQKAILKCHFR